MTHDPVERIRTTNTFPTLLTPRARWGLPVAVLGLAWVALATTFMTSGLGARWARSAFGLRLDADEMGPGMVAVIVLSLLSGLGALIAFRKTWIRREELWPGHCMPGLLAGLLVCYVLGMGTDPRFPLLRFFLHLATTWEGAARMGIYALPGCALLVIFRRWRPNRACAQGSIAFLAGFISLRLVLATQDGWGFLNIADAEVPITSTAAAWLSLGLGFLGRKDAVECPTHPHEETP